jgi:hypothetical protein
MKTQIQRDCAEIRHAVWPLYDALISLAYSKTQPKHEDVEAQLKKIDRLAERLLLAES